GYAYSEALRNSNLIWDEITISDLFDHGPDVVTPGSKMPIQVIKNDSDLNDLVLFLKIATAPQN
ncbi:MAG: cytochrome C, partial [Paracoccaceae bacterium]